MIEDGLIVSDGMFIRACEIGHTEIVHLLLNLERGVNPAARDNEALRFASERGHTEIVRLLLDLERGVAARNNDALCYAISYGHTEIVRMLLNLPLERGARDNGALRNACATGQTEIVRLLLDLPLERGLAAEGNCAILLASVKHGNCAYAAECGFSSRNPSIVRFGLFGDIRTSLS